MQISVKVHLKSSKPRVEFVDNIYHVYISIAPEKGKANEAVLKLLGEFLDKSVGELKIVAGFKSRNKIVDVG